MIEKLFHLKENNTNARTEVIAGLTTFMTMAYILAVNPSILGSTGMDPTAVLLATALASFIGTACMAFMESQKPEMGDLVLVFPTAPLLYRIKMEFL